MVFNPLYFLNKSNISIKPNIFKIFLLFFNIKTNIEVTNETYQNYFLSLLIIINKTNLF